MWESDYLKDNIRFLEKLGQMPTLDAFDEKDLKGLLQLSKIRKYEPDELILEEGLSDSWIYFLVSGKVRVVKNGEDLHILRRAGDVFGEMSMIDGSPRSASVYAVDETVCLATDASHVNKLSANDRVIIYYIFYRIFSEILATRLRSTNEELIKTKEEYKLLKSDSLRL